MRAILVVSVPALLLLASSACNESLESPDGSALQGEGPSNSISAEQTGTGGPSTASSSTSSPGQGTDTPPSDTPPSDTPPSDTPTDPFDMLSGEEQQLYELIMAYRAENGLPSIPLSPSLTVVAQAHATDLELHAAEVLVAGCNMHSWSSRGDWVGCCYPSDHSNMPCMHNKPREMTDYAGSGYEISVFNSGGITASGALTAWQGSSGHNDVILNVGMWSPQWRAIGVGIDGRYGHVWFGRDVDPVLQD